MPTSTGKEDLGRYQVVARVVKTRHTGVASSGPLEFIEAEALDEAPEPVYIMAMGAPRSGPSNQSPRANISQLQVGDLVGVHRGLTWEVNLPTVQPLHSEDDSSRIPRRKWLVAMEWDLVQ